MLLFIPVLAMQAFMHLRSPDMLTPEQEITLMAIYKGVNVNLAHAVAKVETGNIPEESGARDKVVSAGNYGRFQINCTTWKKPLKLDSCEDLLERHTNIWAGLTVLSYVSANRWAKPKGPHHWVAHYNAGVVVEKGSRGERYANKVASYMRTWSKQSRRKFGQFKGW